MALDHYVSQVHLRNFCSRELGGKKMHAIRKRDLKAFPCGSEDVCRIEEGSTNKYLTDERAIEEFLREIEPRYNQSVEKFRSHHIDRDAIFVVAGFTAFVASCAPTAMRINSQPLKLMLNATAKALDARGLIPLAPQALEGKSLSRLLDEGMVKFEVDQKFPQAVGISTIMDRVYTFGNVAWDVIINHDDSSPFFSSDFPVAVEESGDPRVMNRIVPLAPDIAVRIKPDLEVRDRKCDDSFEFFQHNYYEPSHGQVRAINTSIVRCAEELIFFRQNFDWVKPFIRKNADYWIEPLSDEIPIDGEGKLLLTRMRAVRRDRGRKDAVAASADNL